MLNKMSILLGATALLALSTGAAFADPSDHRESAGVAITVGDPGQTGYGNGYNYGYDDGYARRDRDAHYRSDMYRSGQPTSIIAVDLGGIAFGYRDGYWDNGHRWHRWTHRADYRSYRDRNGSNYHDWNHDRDSNDGWQR
jgi:hypothetical protein